MGDGEIYLVECSIIGTVSKERQTLTVTMYRGGKQGAREESKVGKLIKRM